jgi:hypothetical protein
LVAIWHYLGGDGQATIWIYTADGRLVTERHQNVHGGTIVPLEIDASNWANGLYVVRVELGDAKLSTSFVLQK